MEKLHTFLELNYSHESNPIRMGNEKVNVILLFYDKLYDRIAANAIEIYK